MAGRQGEAPGTSSAQIRSARGLTEHYYHGNPACKLDSTYLLYMSHVSKVTDKSWMVYEPYHLANATQLRWQCARWRLACRILDLGTDGGEPGGMPGEEFTAHTRRGVTMEAGAIEAICHALASGLCVQRHADAA